MGKTTVIEAGDPGALLGAAYREHLPAIVRYLARRLGDEVAPDAAADVFLRAAMVDTGAAVSLPWLYGIAANVIHERRRSERRRLRAMHRLASQEIAARTSSSMTVPGLDPDLVAALRKLRPSDRETLLLVVWGELSYEQTAEALQIPLGTVRSRVARARDQLKPSANALGSLTKPLTPRRTPDA